MDEERNTIEKAPGSSAPFVLGLLSLIAAFLLPLAGLPLGITGLVKASRLRRMQLSDGKSEAGWILSLLGIIFSSVSLLFFLPFLSMLPFIAWAHWALSGF